MTAKIGFEMTFTGKVRGVIDKKAGPKNEPSKQWDEHYFCVEGDNFNTHQFKLKKDDVEKNIMETLEKMEGQVVQFKCSQSHRVWNEKVYTEYYFQGEIKKVTV